MCGLGTCAKGLVLPAEVMLEDVVQAVTDALPPSHDEIGAAVIGLLAHIAVRTEN